MHTATSQTTVGTAAAATYGTGQRALAWRGVQVGLEQNERIRSEIRQTLEEVARKLEGDYIM